MKIEHDIPGPRMADLPSGLVTCFVRGEETGISCLSPYGAVLRTEKGGALPEEITLFLRREEADGYERFTLPVTLCGREEKPFWEELAVAFDSPDAAAALKALLLDQNAFVLRRLDGTLTEERLGWREEDDYFPSLEEEKRALLSGICVETLPAGMTTALSLDTPEKYCRFLTTPFADLWRELTAENGLSVTPVPNRVYLGSGWCFHLLPQDWTPLLNRAEVQHLAVTVVLPPAEESDLPQVRALLKLLSERSGVYELVVGDFGTAALAAKLPNIQPVPGLLLNKRLKDPRGDLLSEIPGENGLNLPEYRDALKKTFRMERFEYDGPGAAPAGEGNALHLPWYQTNTGTLCPLRAAVERGDRGAQSREETCPGYCMKTAFAYPENLSMTGRYNSLFALDTDDLIHLQKLPAQGFDRVVWELL